MIEIRIHGRGGQGVVTAAEILGQAVFYNNLYTQTFPNFGVERNGAPIVSYCRIDQKPIRLRSQIISPNILIVQDESLALSKEIWQGMNSGLAIINSTKLIKSPSPKITIVTIPATKISLNIFQKPILNTPLLGAFAALTKLITLENLDRAVQEKFKPAVAALNMQAIETAYNFTREHFDHAFFHFESPVCNST